MLIIADANELFSAMIAKGKTRELFLDFRIRISSPRYIIREFQKHIEIIKEKSELNEEELTNLLLIISQKITFFEPEQLKEYIKTAEKISPDPDDVEYFALALKLNCPIWSEDKDLKKQNIIKIISTSELIQELENM
ncbi:MAG: PIN domain-containing protein [Candidatus Nanoarchaeia archaeon]|nr:PIN domain-containing protein [Candidatus Nanoarchaeia archaeon]